MPYKAGCLYLIASSENDMQVVLAGTKSDPNDKVVQKGLLISHSSTTAKFGEEITLSSSPKIAYNLGSVTKRLKMSIEQAFNGIFATLTPVGTERVATCGPKCPTKVVHVLFQGLWSEQDSTSMDVGQDIKQSQGSTKFLCCKNKKWVAEE